MFIICWECGSSAKQHVKKHRACVEPYFSKDKKRIDSYGELDVTKQRDRRHRNLQRRIPGNLGSAQLGITHKFEVCPIYELQQPTNSTTVIRLMSQCKWNMKWWCVVFFGSMSPMFIDCLRWWFYILKNIRNKHLTLPNPRE